MPKHIQLRMEFSRTDKGFTEAIMTSPQLAIFQMLLPAFNRIQEDIRGSDCGHMILLEGDMPYDQLQENFEGWTDGTDPNMDVLEFSQDEDSAIIEIACKQSLDDMLRAAMSIY